MMSRRKIATRPRRKEAGPCAPRRIGGHESRAPTVSGQSLGWGIANSRTAELLIFLEPCLLFLFFAPWIFLSFPQIFECVLYCLDFTCRVNTLELGTWPIIIREKPGFFRDVPGCNNRTALLLVEGLFVNDHVPGRRSVPGLSAGFKQFGSQRTRVVHAIA